MSIQPNVILILADDMGYGDFGIFNGGRSNTPILDALTLESVCLTQHYSASPVCAPARASLFTGRYPHRTGAIDTLEGRGTDRIALRETTIGDIFKSANYVTGLVGKWHSGALDARYHPNARGFDEFVGFRGGWSDYYKWRLDYNGTFHQTNGRYLTEVLTEEAVQFIDRHHNQTFFLHVAYNAPHFPMQAPEDLVQMYRERGFEDGVAYVYAMIEVMDRGIGRILEALTKYRIAGNTIVMFTSDNGPQLNPWQGMPMDRFNCGFNGAKGTVYEGGIRLPLLIRWPDGLEGGRNFSDMVHFTDWLPTLAEMTGVNITPNLRLDGRNVLPVLRKESGQVNPIRFWQWNRYTPVVTSNAAMRDGNWKLIRPRIPETFELTTVDLDNDQVLKYDPDTLPVADLSPLPTYTNLNSSEPLLFKLDDDPEEQNNLATQYPERVTTMVSELETWFADVERERNSIDDAL